MVMDLETNMKMMGKRNPYLIRYKVDTDNDGRLQTVELDLICDVGWNENEADVIFAVAIAQSCYTSQQWKIQPIRVKTNAPSHTFCRAPGSIKGVAAIETILEHVARACGREPLSVREINLMGKGDSLYLETCFNSGFSPPNIFQTLDDANPIREILKQIKSSGQYEDRKRQIESFNKANRWRKKGMSLVVMRYPVHYISKFLCSVSIYHDDGTVSVVHGGIEMGQGINTKVAQVVARTLGIPLHLIRIKPTDSHATANSFISGGSVTSELNAFVAKKCCDEILARMKPIRDRMPADSPWVELVRMCFRSGVNLSAVHMNEPADNIRDYHIWGACLIDVELDVLTGENIVHRVDIIEDCGLSMSPAVDVGQVEGAFIKVLGFWSSEKIAYDVDTGQLLTNNTWEYKIPTAKDIPEDFRVTLLMNARNQFGVLQSKATGEPPCCLAVGYLFAMRQAIDSARQDNGEKENSWYQMDGPLTVEDASRLTLTSAADLKLFDSKDTSLNDLLSSWTLL